ncbi:MAG: hypothetical protein JNL67_23150 [Planctomycetaceae bacterium]|nr:hypothetical protein [Planctomycetaceae bacterium]
MRNTMVVTLSYVSSLFVSQLETVSPIFAQQSSRELPRNAVDTGFNRKSPDVGELIPNLTAYRADGSQVRLRDLHGKHTVLVFGCLT